MFLALGVYFSRGPTVEIFQTSVVGMTVKFKFEFRLTKSDLYSLNYYRVLSKVIPGRVILRQREPPMCK